MKCSRCGHDNLQGARFCEQCATPLAPTCSSCGTVLSAAAKFCHACAHPVALAARTPSPAPDSYTPRHLAERIIDSKAALEGERKQVTVLFADLKGSMELLADRDPEEARKILDPVLERMMEAVHRYEGTVNQVMGDGIMALFGAPVAHEDHAVRACYAALRMHRRVNLYSDEIRQTGGTPVQIRVGVNSGDVIVRAIGSDLHMDYTAVGQTTHLAARMEQMANPGSALITGATLNLAEGYVKVRPLGSVPVKGLGTPTPVFELTGTVPTRSRLQASARRGLSDFVGRERELEQLGQALDRAAAGYGQAVAVVGEAGVGKSRLAWELTRSHRVDGWLVLESGSVSYGKATPYLPIIEMLKAYCRIQERDEPREIRERVAGKLLRLDRALEPLLTPLLALLDVLGEDIAWTSLDPPQRRHRILDAIKRLLLRVSTVQPLLLIFEDLHWIDVETQALLDDLMESLPSARILLLVNYRPEYRHAWGGKTYYLQLRVDPLPPESADTLLAALLGEDGALEPLKRALIERTEGNPFFLEESVRTLVETRALVGERGAYRVTTAPHTWQIPATAQAILAARIDRLVPEDKQLLQAAAVVGKDVPFALLQAIADVPEDSLRRALSHLQAAEFLYETRLFPDLEYTFKHAFTHQVAYQSLLQDRRRALHARVVDAIEGFYPERLPEQVERLAHHAVCGEMWAKAFIFSRDAGSKAAGRSAHYEAIAHFERALAALQHLPDTEQSREAAIDVRFACRSSLLPLGDRDRILDHLREAEALAQRQGDQRRLGWVATYMTIHFSMISQNTQALASGQRAVALAAAVGDVPLQIVASSYLGQAQYRAGEYRLAVERLRWCVASLTGDLVRERLGQAAVPAVYSRTLLALSLAELGEFSEGTARAREAIQIAELLDHPFSLGLAFHGAGRLFLCKGDVEKAVALLERGQEACRARAVDYWLPVVGASLGQAYATNRRAGDAFPLLEQTAERLASPRLAIYHSVLLTSLSEAYLMANRADVATQHAHEALCLSRDRGERGVQAHAMRLLGDAARHRDAVHLESAEQHYADAMALAKELGMRPLVAHCHLGLAKLYRRAGKRQEAQEHLATATAMYREMGMTYGLENVAP